MGWSRASSSTEQNFSASLGVIGGFVGAALSQRLSAHMGERCYQGQPRFGIAQSMRRTCSNISFIQKLPVTGSRAEYVTSIKPSMACFDAIAKVRRPTATTFGLSLSRLGNRSAERKFNLPYIGKAS